MKKKINPCQKIGPLGIVAPIGSLGIAIHDERIAAQKQVQEFELWQKSECIELNLSIGEHNALLKMAGELEAKGLSNTYSKLRLLATWFWRA